MRIRLLVRRTLSFHFSWRVKSLVGRYLNTGMIWKVVRFLYALTYGKQLNFIRFHKASDHHANESNRGELYPYPT